MMPTALARARRFCRCLGINDVHAYDCGAKEIAQEIEAAVAGEIEHLEYERATVKAKLIAACAGYDDRLIENTKLSGDKLANAQDLARNGNRLFGDVIKIRDNEMAWPAELVEAIAHVRDRHGVLCNEGRTPERDRDCSACKAHDTLVRFHLIEILGTGEPAWGTAPGKWKAPRAKRDTRPMVVEEDGP